MRDSEVEFSWAILRLWSYCDVITVCWVKPPGLWLFTSQQQKTTMGQKPRILATNLIHSSFFPLAASILPSHGGALCKLLNLPKSQFLHLDDESNKDSKFIRLLWGMKEKIRDLGKMVAHLSCCWKLSCCWTSQHLEGHTGIKRTQSCARSLVSNKWKSPEIEAK